MNTTELYQLTEWIDTNVRAKNIAKKYQVIHTTLAQNANPGQQNAIEPLKEDLINSITEIELEQLTVDQIAFLTRMGIAEYVGENAIKHIEDILFRNTLDHATASAEFNKIFDSINNGLAKSKQIKSGLTDLIDPEELPENEALIRVGFVKDSAVNNVDDLKKWSGVWFDIGRGIAMAHGKTPKDVRVIGAKKGSIVIEFAVAYAIAKTTGKIILFALQVADKVLEIKKKAVEVRGMELKNKQIAAELEQEAKDLIEEKKQSITELIFDELGVNNQVDGEKRTALENAIKKLIEFIERGGEVDCILPDEVEDGKSSINAEDIKAIREEFRDIRALENKIKRLEYKDKPIDENDESEE